MIKLSGTQIEILGRPNFACAQIAKMLIAAGVYEDKAKKSKYEQAVFIHWAMGLFDKHGEKWHEAGDQILSECAEKIKNKAAINPPIMSRDQALAQLVKGVTVWPKTCRSCIAPMGWDWVKPTGHEVSLCKIGEVGIFKEDWQAAHFIPYKGN